MTAPAQELFPNGGWDTHHHIFERMYNSFLDQSTASLRGNYMMVVLTS